MFHLRQSAPSCARTWRGRCTCRGRGLRCGPRISPIQTIWCYYERTDKVVIYIRVYCIYSINSFTLIVTACPLFSNFCHCFDCFHSFIPLFPKFLSFFLPYLPTYTSLLFIPFLVLVIHQCYHTFVLPSNFTIPIFMSSFFIISLSLNLN